MEDGKTEKSLKNECRSNLKLEGCFTDGSPYPIKPDLSSRVSFHVWQPHGVVVTPLVFGYSSGSVVPPRHLLFLQDVKLLSGQPLATHPTMISPPFEGLVSFQPKPCPLRQEKLTGGILSIRRADPTNRAGVGLEPTSPHSSSRTYTLKIHLVTDNTNVLVNSLNPNSLGVLFWH